MMPTYSNTHAKVKKWSFSAHFPRNWFEFHIILNDFHALQSEILRFNFYSPCSKILKIPEFTLWMNQNQILGQRAGLFREKSDPIDLFKCKNESYKIIRHKENSDWNKNRFEKIFWDFSKIQMSKTNFYSELLSWCFIILYKIYQPMVGLKLYSEIYQNFRILEKFLGHRVRH